MLPRKPPRIPAPRPRHNPPNPDGCDWSGVGLADGCVLGVAGRDGAEYVRGIEKLRDPAPPMLRPPPARAQASPAAATARTVATRATRLKARSDLDMSFLQRV